MKTYKNKILMNIDALNIEHAGLINKYNRYNKFINSGYFKDMIKNDYDGFLLKLQLKLMKIYGAALEQRISIVKGETSIITLPRMTFGIAIEAMKAGYIVCRDNSNKYIRFDLANEGLAGVTDEFFIVDKQNGSIDSWKPTQEDLLANDWKILDRTEDDDPYLLKLARSLYNDNKVVKDDSYIAPPTDEEIKQSEKELNEDLKKHDKHIGFYWLDSLSNEEIEK